MAIVTFFVLVSIFSLIFALIQYQWSHRRLYKLADRIPGPTGYPIVGSALAYIGQSGDSLLDSIGQTLEYFGPLSKTWLGPVLVVNVSDPLHMKAILNSDRCLKKPYLYNFLGVDLGLMVVQREYDFISTSDTTNSSERGTTNKNT